MQLDILPRSLPTIKGLLLAFPVSLVVVVRQHQDEPGANYECGSMEAIREKKKKKGLLSSCHGNSYIFSHLYTTAKWVHKLVANS